MSFDWGWPAAIIAAIGHAIRAKRLTRMPRSQKCFSTMRSQLRANNNHSAWDQCQLRSSALFRATGHSPTRSDPNIELPVAQGDPIQVADLSEGVRSAVNNDHPAHWLPRFVGGAAHPWGRCRRHVGGPPPHARRIRAKHHRSDQDFCGAIGGCNRERAYSTMLKLRCRICGPPRTVWCRPRSWLRSPN